MAQLTCKARAMRARQRSLTHRSKGPAPMRSARTLLLLVALLFTMIVAMASASSVSDGESQLAEDAVGAPDSYAEDLNDEQLRQIKALTDKEKAKFSVENADDPDFAKMVNEMQGKNMKNKDGDSDEAMDKEETPEDKEKADAEMKKAAAKRKAAEKNAADQLEKAKKMVKALRPKQAFQEFCKTADSQVAKCFSSAGTFYEQFGKDSLAASGWIVSTATKTEGEDEKKYTGEWQVADAASVELSGAAPGDYALTMESSNSLYAVSRKFETPIEFSDTSMFVAQFEVKQPERVGCGGSYMKLLALNESREFQPETFGALDGYSIMFGPDRCGTTSKVHFIFRYPHPKTGELREHHLINAPLPVSGKESMLYTLKIFPKNNSVTVLINGEKAASAKLNGTDFTPAVVPEATLPDPEHIRPKDWDEREFILDTDQIAMIPDEKAVRPDDWDESMPRTVCKEGAVRPEYWNDEEDGIWECPLVPNPACAAISGCGVWERPMIKNPDYDPSKMIKNPSYSGVWKQRTIDNPDYVQDDHVGMKLLPITAVGFELWTVESGTMFDNILVSSTITEDELKAWTDNTWTSKYALEKKMSMIMSEATSSAAQADSEKTAPLGITPVPWLEQFTVAGLREFVALVQESPMGAARAYPAIVGTITAVVIVLVSLMRGMGRRQRASGDIHTSKSRSRASGHSTATSSSKSAAGLRSRAGRAHSASSASNRSSDDGVDDDDDDQMDGEENEFENDASEDQEEEVQSSSKKAAAQKGGRSSRRGRAEAEAGGSGRDSANGE